MKILQNPSLKSYNTFHLPVHAREMVILESKTDLQEIFNIYSFDNVNYLVLGEGSNILFTQDFDGLIISSSMDQIKILKEDDQYTWLEVDAGLNWHSLVEKTIGMGLQGLENLSLIPGKVGAAPIQNIGAYGVEIETFMESVKAIDLSTQQEINFSKKECEFGYRTSIFKTTYKNQFIIHSIVLRLNKIPDYNISYENIRETLEILNLKELTASTISKAVIYIRKNKLPDPDIMGNAGSFFKNPIVDKMYYDGLKTEFPGIKGYEAGPNLVKIPAAWLIENCGWKGKRYKNAGVHDDQPLVLVNHGNASGIDILELSRDIQKSISDTFGIILESEVYVI